MAPVSWHIHDMLQQSKPNSSVFVSYVSLISLKKLKCSLVLYALHKG